MAASSNPACHEAGSDCARGRVATAVVPAISVFSFNSSDHMVYRHSAPWLRRMPLTRMNRDSEADSDPSTKTINSPGTNVSRLRVSSSVALNASFTRNLVIATSMLLFLRCPFSKGSQPAGCIGL